MFKKIGNIAKNSWKWLSGKKRWIAITAGLVAKVLPSHTFGHQAGEFISNNSDTIFTVVSSIAIGEVAIQKAKDKFDKRTQK